MINEYNYDYFEDMLSDDVEYEYEDYRLGGLSAEVERLGIDKSDQPPEFKNPLYCHCGSDNVVKAWAAGEEYDYCRACKKERK